MKLKKLLVTPVLILTVVLVLFAATSCDLLHEHNFSEWENVTEPTCTAFGLQKRSCECGQVEYDTIDALAHTPVIDAAVDATCTTLGKTEGSHCGVCNAIIVAQTENDKFAHAFSAWETVTAPTCTSFGLQKRECECGQVEYATLSVLNHNVVTDAAIDATCTTTGKTEGSHCLDCGFVIVAQTETNKISHSFSEWGIVTAPTCTSFGLRKRVCECGYAEFDTAEALSHTIATDAAVNATCTTSGKTEGSHCDTCGTIITVQNTIAPTGHNCDNVSILEEAFCNHDGIKRYSCSNLDCSYYYDESYALAELDGREIYANAVQYTGVLQTFDRFGNPGRSGSAFVISDDGYIATSNLLIDNASSAIFVLGDVYYDVIEVVAFSTSSNIAILRIDATDLPYANLCVRDPIDAEKVYIVGAPSGFEDAVSSGVISNANRVLGESNFIQHDADMTSGYVGGPLINRYGEVIGINIGFIGDDHLNLSAWTAEIGNLDYSCPMSMEEYGSITYTPTEELDNWIVNNYNATNSGAVAYVIQGNDFYYSLGYDTASGYSFAEGYWVKEGNYQLYVRVIFDNCYGVYQYYATLTNGIMQNEAYGYIDAESYTASTILTYDTFYGKYWNESELMALYSTAVYDTLEWFSYCLDTYFDRLTLETFGFTGLSYDRDEEALNKLNNFIMTYGMYEQVTESYVLSGGAQMGEDYMSFNIAYHPATDETVVSVHYNLASGEVYSVYLTLNTTENGNRFDFMYAAFYGEEYVINNLAWGYLDAGTFTSASKLTCYVFDGMNEYEDALLMDYTSFLTYVMGLLNNSVMPSVDPTLTVADLGFFFYFG